MIVCIHYIMHSFTFRPRANCVFPSPRQQACGLCGRVVPRSREYMTFLHTSGFLLCWSIESKCKTSQSR